MDSISAVRHTMDTRVSSREQTLKKASQKSFSKEMGSALGRFNTRDTRGTEAERLRKASLEMESLFVAKMLKEMRKTIHKTEWLNGGHAEEVFEDMLYDEYALNISKNSNLGLAKQIYKEMSRHIKE